MNEPDCYQSKCGGCKCRNCAKFDDCDSDKKKCSWCSKRGMIGVPEIGWVTLSVEGPKRITVDTSGIASVVKPCKVVGRDARS